MGVITTASCIYNCCCAKRINYYGHKIFKPIETKIKIDENESNENKEIIKEYEKLLEKSEENRKEIAKKFEAMLIDTGSCVLRKPNMERTIITYLVQILIKLNLAAKKKKINLDKEDLKISNLIGFSIKPPFINFNDKEFDKLKEKYDFDFEHDTNLQKGKLSILDFLSSLEKNNEIISLQINQIKNTLSKIKSFKNLKLLKNGFDAVNFFFDVINEIISSFSNIGNTLNQPQEMELLNKISEDAVQKNIFEPMQICFNYSYGECCKNIADWKENMTYQELELELKY